MWQAFIIGLTAGIAATPHCLGMCGGFPLHLAKSTGTGRVSTRQILFVVGKTFTYVFLGSLAGALGVILLKNTPFSHAVAALRITAGAVTAFFGLLMLGFRLPSIKPLQGIADSRLVKGVFGELLNRPGPGASFVLGLGTGFLPCPLPIAMLTVAAASHNIAHGMLLMAGVGLGTAPGLLGVGLFGAGINKGFSRIGMKAAGVLALSIGLITLARTTGVIHAGHAQAGKPAAPCCSPGEQAK